MSLDKYNRSSKIGRGTRLSRMDRIKVWPVFAEYKNLLTSDKKREVDDSFRGAAALIAREPDALPYSSVAWMEPGGTVQPAGDLDSVALELLLVWAWCRLADSGKDANSCA